MIAIACVEEGWGIGYKGQLLNRIPDDMKRFRRLTRGNTVIMGRSTYESIGYPLPDRTNIVLSRDPQYKPKGVLVCHSVKDAIGIAKTFEVFDDKIFVIGGEQIYREFMPYVNKVYLTTVEGRHKDVDAYFPALSSDEWDIEDDSGTQFCPDTGVHYNYINFKRR